MRLDDPLNTDMEVVSVIDASGIADDDRDIVLHSHQCDALVCGGFSAEKIDEYVLALAVLIADDTESVAGFEYVDHGISGALFVNDGLTAKQIVVNVTVDVRVVDGAGDIEHWHSKSVRRTTEYQEIAVMGGYHYGALFVEYEFDYVGYIAEIDAAVPIGRTDQAGRIEYVEREHDEMLEAASCGAFVPCVGFVGIAVDKIVDGPLTSAMVNQV